MLDTGSYLRVTGWGPRAPRDLSEGEKELYEASRVMLDGIEGGYCLCTTLDNEGEPTTPAIVLLSHVVAVTPIK